MAFKLLNKNLPVPASIQHAIFSNLADDGPTDPRDLLNELTYAEHSDRQNRPLVPALLPSGVDFEAIATSREAAINNRIVSRMSELELLPSNVDAFAFKTESDAKLRLLIEYKSLKLLTKQKQMRESMLHALPSFMTLAATHNRAGYRRIKTQNLRESRLTDSMERQQRTERERREKQKQLDYLTGITAHAAAVAQDAQATRAKAQKLGRGVLAYHSYIEKEEQRRIERNAKQRLQALKADDEEAYMALIDQAKDTRITHLLKQTNTYLDSLAEAVKQQQGHNRTLGPGESERDEKEGKEEGTTAEEAQELDYYQIAHKIQETILEQPRILVGGTLKEYQLKGLQWMISLYNNRLNGILADEMGLGKTIQTISLITFLIEKKKQDGPFLVIVPLSTLTNWTLEFEKWAPSVHKIVYKGAPSTRRQLATGVRQGAFQVLLTTFEYIIKDRPILSKIKWLHMIIDEGHRMKNANSKLSNTLVTYYNTKYRLILTGTPLQNNLPELWALLNFVLPKIFNSVKSFDEWFNTPFANTGGQDKMELSEEESLLVIRRLHKVLRPFLLRRLKKDVEKDLPDKVENVIKCPLSSLQKKLYDQMKKHGMLFVSDDGSKGGKAQGIKGLNNTLMQLRKICNHPFVFEDVERSIVPEGGNNDQLWRVAGKFELLDRILPKFKRTGHRVLMFFQMTQIMNIMEDFLHFRGHKYMRLDGSTKADDRSAMLKDFNHPESDYFIFLLSTRAGGLGLNLQTADTVIIYDSDWNPHQDLQAQDRAHRIGQTKEVRILRLITDKSIEESILARAQYKLDIDGKVIQAGKFDNKSTAEEREAFLRSLLDSDPAADAEAEPEEEEEQDDELNEIIARNDDELRLFKQMDVDRDIMSPYGPTKALPRLMSDKELPDVYHQEDHAVAEDFFAIGDAGKRERKEANYDDGLTEEEWTRAVDEGEDPAELISRRRRKPKSGATTGEVSGATSPVPSSTGSIKKRNRHSRAASIDPESTPRKRIRTTAGPGPSALSQQSVSTAARGAMQKIFMTCLHALDDLVADDGHGRTDVFIVLPQRKEYPSYYTLIKRPISLTQIKRKVKREQYDSVHAFRADFELMFANARAFNEEGSWIVQDAVVLEEALKAKLESMAPGGNVDLGIVDSMAEPSDSGSDHMEDSE
ncbi:SNF2 family N-terminal domain-domain-containing protein [Protomyces lactucae-debilis]|uniref:SNF2 family N-terminal domain-domain-containing protein n=1 Tax=Protomyces lactucae-debilis TaxID=2754530 RepID=A0A1Y2FSB7_PROLT|nr:SNF2 family N-terminal domain-containing protein [Protomyces lactucae-debilis]ORY86891.1 SNF2 family N-terminal domain-domain-containing protein [Protomyces lactucae-debilis]